MVPGIESRLVPVLVPVSALGGMPAPSYRSGRFDDPRIGERGSPCHAWKDSFSRDVELGLLSVSIRMVRAAFRGDERTERRIGPEFQYLCAYLLSCTCYHAGAGELTGRATGMGAKKRFTKYGQVR